MDARVKPIYTFQNIRCPLCFVYKYGSSYPSQSQVVIGNVWLIGGCRERGCQGGLTYSGGKLLEVKGGQILMEI